MKQPLTVLNGKRFYWTLAIAYVGLIYLSLPIMPSIVSSIRHALGDEKFRIVLNLVLIVPALIVIVGALRISWKNALLVLIPLTLIASSFHYLRGPVEKIHFLEYGLLGLLVFSALKQKTILHILMAIGFLLAAGIIDEGIQWVLPNRHGDPYDVAMNAAGGLLGLWVGWLALKR